MRALPPHASISLRETHLAQLLAQRPPLPFIEVVADNFLALRGPHYAGLRQLSEHYPILLHCVGFSFGSAQPPAPDYTRKVATMAQELGALNVTDHLSLSALNDEFIHDLLPIRYHPDSLQALCDNLSRVQEALPVPLLLENPSRYLAYADDEMSEGNMMTKLVQRTGIGVLMDINNLYVTGHNLGLCPQAMLADYPQEAIDLYHLAGHHAQPPLLVDSHSAAICPEVWQLYEYAITQIGPRPTIIEWDNQLPPLPTLIEQAQLAQAYLQAAPVLDGTTS
ncbi:DUF692 domain-containing protein [Ferrimonas pelagia]|uniref:DUF692 domain-containing protein n=1 Tax=Ferrimonas pelagia TaxID=1177826 RepID=A0ABP9EH80_9GAMM